MFSDNQENSQAPFVESATETEKTERQPEKLNISPEERGVIDENRKKIEARLEELSGASYQGPDARKEAAKLEADLRDLDAGRLNPEYKQKVVQNIDARRREIEAELEDLSRATIVTPGLKEKRERLENELGSLTTAAGKKEKQEPPADAKEPGTGEVKKEEVPISGRGLTPEEINRSFESGTPIDVKVIGAAGALEAGWQALSVNPDGFVRVGKRGEDGKEIYRDVSLIDLRLWNPRSGFVDGTPAEREAGYQERINQAREAQSVAYTAWRSGKKSKKSEAELSELLKNAESARDSHHELVAKYVSSLIEEKKHELESDPEKESKLSTYKAELFNEYFVKEYERMQEREVESFPPKQKGIFQKAVNWWMRQPRWERMAISIGVSTAIAVGTGAIGSASGMLVFGGATLLRRYLSGGASVATRAATELGFKGWDKIFGGEKKGLSYQERRMRGKFSGASFEEFMKMQSQYAEMRTLAEQREKRRRIGALAAQIGAGVATSMLLSGHIDAVEKALHISPAEIMPVSGGSSIGAENALASKEHLVAIHGLQEHLPTSPNPSEYIQSMDGESVWNRVSDILQNTKQFDLLHNQLEAQGLSGADLAQHFDAAKTYYIDAIKDRVVADPSKYIVDGKMNLSEFFTTQSGENWLHNTVMHAAGLSPAEAQNILHNNEILAQFAAKFPHEQLPTVEEAQRRLVEVSSASGANLSYSEWLSRLNNETLTPSVIQGALNNHEMLNRLAEARGVSPAEMEKILTSAHTGAVNMENWMGSLRNETLQPISIEQVIADPRWVDRLAQFNGISPTEMHDLLERSLEYANNMQSWLNKLRLGQLKVIDIEQVVNDPQWISRLAQFSGTNVDNMRQMLNAAYEQALKASTNQ